MLILVWNSLISTSFSSLAAYYLTSASFSCHSCCISAISSSSICRLASDALTFCVLTAGSNPSASYYACRIISRSRSINLWSPSYFFSSSRSTFDSLWAFPSSIASRRASLPALFLRSSSCFCFWSNSNSSLRNCFSSLSKS